MPAGSQATETLFRTQRPRLFGIAYRMLGSVTEAEDAVQEAFARYQRLDHDAIESPDAFLTTTVTRIAIDQLRSMRAQREQYVGEWLPEPLLEAASGPDEQAVMADSLSMAFLVLLESLTPVERAVFLLREAFDFSYEEIGEIVGRKVEHCRQIALRARRHVDARRPRFEPSRAERDRLAHRFFAACEDGDTGALIELLAADCVFYGDGGGKAPALSHPLRGADHVARALITFVRLGGEIGARLQHVTVNGQPGARFLAPGGRLINVVALDINHGRVEAVRSVVNPQKLTHLGPVADIRALMADRRRRR